MTAHRFMLKCSGYSLIGIFHENFNDFFCLTFTHPLVKVIYTYFAGYE